MELKKIFYNLKNIYEKISGFPVAQCNWEKMAEKLTENKFFFQRIGLQYRREFRKIPSYSQCRMSSRNMSM